MNESMIAPHKVGIAWRPLAWIACTSALLQSTMVFAAADVKLAQIPLAKSASQAVAPNLLFILDDSGSMAWDYTPDFVDDALCRATNSTTSLTSCKIGHPPYVSSGFNKQYYNPNFRYTPGLKADGTAYPEMTTGATTGWTKVPMDGYNTSSTKSNIVAQYPDISWSKSGGGSVTNTSYAYPNDFYKTAASIATGPYYYNLKPIYCKADDGKDCQLEKTAVYKYEMPYRWCKSGTFSDCQYKKTSTYKIPSFIKPEETGDKAVLEFTIAQYNKNETKTVNSIKVNGEEILTSTPISYKATASTAAGSCAGLVNAISSKINTAKFTATKSSCVLTLTAVSDGEWANDAPEITGTAVISSTRVVSNGTNAQTLFSRVDIKPAVLKYQVNGGKPGSRTDCVAYSDGCSYTEEMTNFANWYAYYRTRTLMMKTAVSQAFKDIDKTFRVGFTQINKLKDRYVKIDSFESTHRSNWYAKLLAAEASGGTPLRGALSFAGQLFAGKKPLGVTDDPMQYSCQQNFTLLTTDGYWNGNDSGSGVVDLNGAVITDQDAGLPPPYGQGTKGTAPSLADASLYFYNTDLRTPALGNCTSPSTGANVCENNVPVSTEDTNNQQHMVTFTLGLGIDGELRYRPDYKTATSGDYYQIKQGTLQWPAPTNDAQAAIDDLWHAAVNGRGQYFSAQDPEMLVSSLKQALANIAAQFGAGAAAATSTMEPVTGDNHAYVATYMTGNWTGNLEAREINLTTGNVGIQAKWCAEDIPADPVKGVTACIGSMTSLVGENSDTRKIYFNKGGTLSEFKLSNLAALLANFDVTKLNQYTGWSADYRSHATPETLINYLRGQTGFDTNDSNEYRLYRHRAAVLGDFVGSAPKYVQKAVNPGYKEPGYSGFANAVKTRKAVIYIGGNDGMLHAFDAANGQELWAYVPTPVLGEMWRLADTTYPNDHRFFVDGPVAVGDVCISGCDTGSAVWKTILIATLGGGVVSGNDPLNGSPNSGYVAFDVTNPDTPTLLWEITSKHATLGSKIGFSVGKPWLAKLSNGTWGALLSSGINPSNNGSALMIVDAYTGAVINTANIAGSRGFSRFSPQFVEPGVYPTAHRVYGGDLNGNVWRIDISDLTDLKVSKIMSVAGQSFTTAPELTVCNGKTVVYLGSGKFLEAADMTDKTPQNVYGFLDDFETNGLLGKSDLDNISSSKKTGKDNQKGWYFDLTDIPSNGGAERVALVDPKLEGNIITIATNIPESGICLASGRSNLYQAPIRTCAAGEKYPAVLDVVKTALGNSLLVGLSSMKMPNGTIKLIGTGSDGKVTTYDSGKDVSTTPYSSRRVTWRELLRD